MWRWQQPAHWPNNDDIICENTSICSVYCIIFPIFYGSCHTLFTRWRHCHSLSLLTCFRSLFVFYLIFFDFQMFAKHQTLEQFLRLVHYRNRLFDTLNSIYYCLFHFVSFPSSSTPFYCHHHYRHRFSSSILLLFTLSVSLLHLSIAILFDNKMWICAVSFNMWLNVYNGITLWCAMLFTYLQCDYIKPIEFPLLFITHAIGMREKSTDTDWCGIGVRAIDDMVTVNSIYCETALKRQWSENGNGPQKKCIYHQLDTQ